MKNRVIWKMFVLEIITLGIYRLYWLIKTRREMMENDKEIKIMNPIVLIVPMILIVASFIPMITTSEKAAAKLPAHCSTYSSSYTTPVECEYNPAMWALGLFIVAILCIWPLIIVWMWGYAKGVEKITNEKMGFPIALLILYIVPDGVDILLVQDAFNKIAPKPASGAPQIPTAV